MPDMQVTTDDLLKKIGTLSVQVDILQTANQGLARENEVLKKELERLHKDLEAEATKTEPKKGK